MRHRHYLPPPPPHRCDVWCFRLCHSSKRNLSASVTCSLIPLVTFHTHAVTCTQNAYCTTQLSLLYAPQEVSPGSQMYRINELKSEIDWRWWCGGKKKCWTVHGSISFFGWSIQPSHQINCVLTSLTFLFKNPTKGLTSKPVLLQFLAFFFFLKLFIAASLWDAQTALIKK